MRPEARFIKWETAVKSLSTIKCLSHLTSGSRFIKISALVEVNFFTVYKVIS